MNLEESLAKSLDEIGIMISTMVGAMQEMDASLKVRTRGAGIKRFDVDGIKLAAETLGKRFLSRME